VSPSSVVVGRRRDEPWRWGCTPPLLDLIWRFVRGDLSVAEFERRVYEDEELETALGADRYLALISTDFRDPVAVRQARQALERYARSATPMACECVALADTAVVDMADPGSALDHLRDEARRGEPYWWLHLSRCGACGTPWLVAQEERQNDVFILRRLTGEEARGIVAEGRWPAYLDRYDTLLRLGSAAGHSVRFLDPVGDSSLAWTMADLARERPGIGVAELAALLNLDLDTAAAVADQAISRLGAAIDPRRSRA
jgi:hypothetical protein